jgi:very-short-patch-repair endonuclease
MFSQHPKAIFWSNKNEKKPNEVALNSHKKFWFDCECGHAFDIQLNNLTIKNGWCPYCVNKKICNIYQNCQSCLNKSLASINYSKNWSDTNKEIPEEVFKNSHKKYLFVCPTCKHTYEQRLSHITRGSCCSYCHNRQLCDNKQNCSICLNKTFASIERSLCWSDKNILKPYQVFKSVATKFWFDCDKCGNEFESKLCHITDGSWCPFCVNKTEQILFDVLKEKYNTLKSQYKVDWCKNKKHLPFDFVIEERKIIIELDGEQHFEQIGKWKSPEETKKNDLYKMKCANDNGFSIIRILQKDVYKNKYDWLNELILIIEKLTTENIVQNIYMCKNNEYK